MQERSLERGTREIDLDRLVWDQEYRQTVKRRLNAVLVISPQPAYLEQAQTWVESAPSLKPSAPPAPTVPAPWLLVTSSFRDHGYTTPETRFPIKVLQRFWLIFH